jgi:hypothetical protein
VSHSTVVNAPLSGQSPAPPRAPSRPERFQRPDFVAAGVVLFVTLGVYIATLSPSVTLEDSGELITAATKFGVGHPPGYPLWTMLGFLLSHLFPFGNLAWRINLQDAIIGAAANAILTLLVCHSGRWLLQRWAAELPRELTRLFSFYTGMFAGFTIGFSNLMWGQAVIAAVHGTLNALFINLVLLLFYLWMLEPPKTHRIVIAVFVFALGLTNHHTLIQIIPAMLVAALFLRAGKFWSVFFSVTLFSLSNLVYLSWLSSDDDLHRISHWMAVAILTLTALVSFYYLKRFRLRPFLSGALIAVLVFAYGHYFMGPDQFDHRRFTAATAPIFWLRGSLVHPGWLQITTNSGFLLLGLAALALGLLCSSSLDRRMIFGVFAAGWVGLVPYAYEPFASSTHPPMNWGYTSERAGFYYAVSREQYPESLPNLIKNTIGKAIGVIPRAAQTDTGLGRPDYLHRLGLTFLYYAENALANFTAPLLILALALLVYLRRCDWPQVNWLIFLGTAFFCLAFMLLVIEPQEAFDFERNLQYEVFNLQSHCILVIFMGYGALAALAYLHEVWPESIAPAGVLVRGVPVLFLSLFPLWINADRCTQAGHWFGWDYGTDMMRPMDRNAVYFGGSDPGRFVPTYMAFVESQQFDYWKHDPSFDRRDVTVITQNALCDTYYCQYIRDQYDPRFRPTRYTAFEKWLGRDKAYPEIPVTCVSQEELNDCWTEYKKRPEVIQRVRSGGPVLRPGSNDVFDINGIVAWRIFQKNKARHTFYLEQSIAIDWMYPYLLPAGLIFKLNPDPMKALPPAAIADDRRFWDAYAARLLEDGHFRPDDHAAVTFAKLAYWHADLYRYWHLDAEAEYFLRLAIRLCPQLEDAVNSLSRLLVEEHHFDAALAVVQQGQLDDPRNEFYESLVDWIVEGKSLADQEWQIRHRLGRTPQAAYDVDLNLQLARILESEGKRSEVRDRLRFVAGLTNWDRAGMSGVVQYYVDGVHDPDAAVAFLETRARIDPKASEMVYSLAALHASLNHRDQALQYLKQAIATGGTNAIMSAKIDPRFQGYQNDPQFQLLVNMPTSNAAPPSLPAGALKTSVPPAKPPVVSAKKK